MIQYTQEIPAYVDGVAPERGAVATTEEPGDVSLIWKPAGMFCLDCRRYEQHGQEHACDDTLPAHMSVENAKSLFPAYDPGMQRQGDRVVVLMQEIFPFSRHDAVRFGTVVSIDPPNACRDYDPYCWVHLDATSVKTRSCYSIRFVRPVRTAERHNPVSLLINLSTSAECQTIAESAAEETGHDWRAGAGTDPACAQKTRRRRGNVS